MENWKKKEMVPGTNREATENKQGRSEMRVSSKAPAAVSSCKL